MMADMDDAYANGAYIDGADAYPPRWAKAAQAFRAALGARAEVGVVYGDSPRQVYDFFAPEHAAQGVLIFVHGGYWRAFDNSSWSHLAAGALARDWAVAMPSYDLCPQVRIADITQQIAATVQAVAARTEGPISLAGHSAGGHLVARMLDRAVLPDAVGHRVRRVVPISPLADLEPLRDTAMNADFQLDEGAARAESPVRMTDRYGAQVAVWVGAQERPAFLDQARWLSQAWAADLVIAPGRHHFDVIDPLAEADSNLTCLLTS